MNPNQMIYFNALVVQRDFNDEARRSRESERAPARPAEARARTRGRDHNVLGLLGLALPGRR